MQDEPQGTENYTILEGEELKFPEPNYTMSFHFDGEIIGTFDFNQTPVTFTGDADLSAKVFINWVVEYFDRHVGPVLKDAALATITAERDELKRRLIELEKHHG